MTDSSLSSAAPPSARRLQTLLGVVFFVSGTAALVYEVVWTRFLVLFLGNTAHAHAVLLATYMGGLAIGYSLFGRAADRRHAHADGARRLLTLYAALEGAIGLYGFLFPLLMKGASVAFLAAARGLGADSPGILPLSLGVSVLVLLPPTILMGGTLPVLIAWAAARPDQAGSATARFYAVNSAGAVLGALLTGFVLVEHLGQTRTVFLAAALNLGLAAAALLLARSLGENATLTRGGSEEHHPVVGDVPWWMPRFAAFASGFAALLLEVVWIRIFTLVFGSSTQSFTVIVAAFITGITLGAMLAHRLIARSARPVTLLALCAVASALLVLASQPAYQYLPWWLARMRMHFGPSAPELKDTLTLAFYKFQAAKFAVSFAFMLAPTVLSGLILPLASHLGARTPGKTGAEVGRIFALNTIGSVLAAATTGTLLIPFLSMRGCIVAGILAYLAIAFAAAVAESDAPRSRAVLIVVGVCFVGLPLAEKAIGWDQHILNAGEFRRNSAVPPHAEWLHEQRKAKLVFYEEGPTTTVAVMGLADGKRFLKVNGKADASNIGDVVTQAGIGAVGALLADAPQSALVIGFGSGVTANTLLKFGLDVDVVEIEPAVLRAAPYFKDVNDDCLASPRLHTHIADARTYLQVADRKFDVLVSEPSNPWVAGISSLFTREFFQVTKDHLTEGGAFVQWFHLYDMDDEMVRLILRTLGEVYPSVTVWHIENDIALVARKTSFDRNLDRMQARFRLPEVRTFFNKVGVYDMFALLSMQLASEEGFRVLMPQIAGPLHVDDLPWLEYRAPKAQFGRSYAFLFVARDERMLIPRDERQWATAPGRLLINDWLRGRTVSMDEAIDFTLIQSQQRFSPEQFRFLFFDRVIDGCKEPWTLARLVANLDKSKRDQEAERALSALAAIEPKGARVALLKAQMRLKRLSNEAAKQDPELRGYVEQCVAATKPGEIIGVSCRAIADLLGLPTSAGGLPSP